MAREPFACKKEEEEEYYVSGYFLPSPMTSFSFSNTLYLSLPPFNPSPSLLSYKRGQFDLKVK